MSRKNLLIIISVILSIFVLALVAYYFLIVQNQVNPDGTTGGFKNFFPFGGSTATSTDIENPPVTKPENPVINFEKKLRKIWTEPVAGAGLMDVKLGTIVRHVERATGHIYETELFSPSQKRISNTTIPFIYNAIWGNKNNSFIAQYLSENNYTINTNVITLKNSATTSESVISGYSLAKKVIDVSAFGNNMFYLTQSDNGTVGFLSAFDGLKRKQIWNSHLRELLSQMVNDTTIALTTKPYPNIAGFIYTINTNTGSVKKLIGNIAGLSALVSNDASKVLYLSQTVSAQMFLYDKKNETSQNITPATFPEKCVWSKKDANIVYCAVPREFLDGMSLTDWYIGNISFTDDIWKYNLKQNSGSLIDDLSNESGESIDVIKPLLSDSEQYIVFINKRDGSLWSLDLSKNQ